MRREGERGAALLTVLLLVAVIAVIAATTLERLRVSTRLAANAGAMEQARALAMSAETLAVTKVTDILARDPSRVTLAGGWSDAPFTLPLPGGIATARVRDGGNCFNLNSLVTEQEKGVYVANPVTIAQFARLLQLLGISGNPQGIAASAADWIDSDDGVSPGGAEDGAYLGLDPGYRTANTLMADPSELRAVAGVSAETYAKARPWLCALPEARPSVLNVNTLTPEQAPLLAMLVPALGVAGAQGVILRRPPQGWDNIPAFWTVPSLGGVTPDQTAQMQTAITTKWFALRIDAAFGGVDLEEHALIDATGLPARLVRRQWGEDL